jgi:type IV pilus assembly protein PilW
MMTTSRIPHWQRGRTLIELLVSIALGLLILLGVGTLYLGANQTTRVTTNVSVMEESAGTIVALLGASVRRAGYSEIAGVGQDRRTSFLYDGPHLQGCRNQHYAVTAGDPLSFACGGAAQLAGNDVLVVWYQADNRVAAAQADTLDCLGNTAPLWTVAEPTLANAVPVVGALPAGQIRLVRNVFYVDAAGNLMCEGSGNAAPQPLVPGVEQFRVFYGFDDVAYANPTAVVAEPVARSLRDAAFLDAQPGLGNLNAWDFVVSVHVCVVLRSQEVGVRVGTATYQPCPADAVEAAGDVPAVAPPADGAFRRAFNQVFTLRSRSTPAPLG